MLKREWGAETNGKLLQLFILSKTTTLVPKLTWKTCLWAELQPWCGEFAVKDLPLRRTLGE